MRHGEALNPGVDPARGLSAEGVKQVEATARAAVRRGVSPLRIFHSEKKRAKETAAIMAGRLSLEDKLEMAGGLSPNEEPDQWVMNIEEMDEDIMLVGHLPHLPRLASILLSGDEQGENVTFFTATMAAIEKGDDNCWKLIWTITASDERALSPPLPPPSSLTTLDKNQGFAYNLTLRITKITPLVGL